MYFPLRAFVLRCSCCACLCALSVRRCERVVCAWTCVAVWIKSVCIVVKGS